MRGSLKVNEKGIGPSEEFVPDGGTGESSEGEQWGTTGRNPGEEGTSAGRLSTDHSSDSGGSDSSDSVPQTEKRKRGRPAGSKNKVSGTGGRGRTELCERMVNSGAGLLTFGFQGIGQLRARPFRKVNNHLANLVVKCWHVPPEVTVEISRPLAHILERYLPDKAKQAVDIGLEPCEVVMGCWQVMSHCADRERQLIAEFRASRQQQEPVKLQADDVSSLDPLEGREVSFDMINDEEPAGVQ